MKPPVYRLPSDKIPQRYGPLITSFSIQGLVNNQPFVTPCSLGNVC